jgi:CRISPR-associated endonuclease Cas1
MQNESTPTPRAPRNGVLVLTGYGIRVAVERGHLAVSDGVGNDRRCGRFSKITHDIKRLVVIGHTGTISFDALRWLHDIGASFVQIDADGQVIVASGPVGLDDAKLRRAQALASINGVGMAIARDLVGEKCLGQLTILRQLLNDTEAAERIEMLLPAFADAQDAERLRKLESDAAREYWQAWTGIPITFAKKDVERVPEHWKTFGTRTSVLAASPRNATNPANALLNYCYAILEAETRIAAIAVGLDPAMGILHADQRGRDSLACDLMEAARPAVDAFVLDLLRTRTFRKEDFVETRQGVCRVLPPLTKLLAESAPRWAKAIAPIVEGIAKRLFEAERVRVDQTKQLPTLLTQMNRSAGRNAVRREPKRDQSTNESRLPATCRGCGCTLSDRRRRYCDVCLPEHEEERRAKLACRGPEALAQMRAEGKDPARTPEALVKLSMSMKQRKQEQRDWNQENGNEQPDPEVFKREILPRLRAVSTSALMQATGLSRPYCAAVRSGKKTPHQRHWDALKAASAPMRHHGA